MYLIKCGTTNIRCNKRPLLDLTMVRHYSIESFLHKYFMKYATIFQASRHANAQACDSLIPTRRNKIFNMLISLSWCRGKTWR